ncbi:hypothetical protein IEQ34_011895 [Dendrobium chrysotoxum]|uniref:14-3-3 domain-containing protein n=1 Tax=Dendrobium chrysotoxum TaxID=161865 RepID=A0AAV7GSV4_DENCH|nr:hypothetical protein IEQ34_011895 [Dendrobium chrysotoxum]
MLLSGAKLRRKILFRKAKLAEEAKRYDHVLRFMKEILETTNPDTDLSPKERCLLGAAFKNFVIHPRNSLSLATVSTGSWLKSFKRSLAVSYLDTSRTEISSACAEIVQLIDRRLLPSAISKESKVYYLTLKGEFSWYLAEVKGAFGKEDAVVANSAYADAWKMAIDLDLMNPHRLALEFSLAEHLFEYLKSPRDALEAVERALDVPAFSAPDTRPVVSLLTFEGGLQFTVNLLTFGQKLRSMINE